jgi:glutathione-specific gamma-glutamylcyclotransferase
VEDGRLLSASPPLPPDYSAAEPLPPDDPFHYSQLELPRGDLWVFTYGSLMWNPGFKSKTAASALLRGYHRAFCIYSSRYRGTISAPGLVLGLDRGGACRGTAYRVAADDIPAVLEQLWRQEMRRRVYVPRLLQVTVGTERRTALTFLANRRHDSYAGALDVDVAAGIIAGCCGERGPNVDYLVNTLQHLDALGVHDHHLHRLLEAVRARPAC